MHCGSWADARRVLCVRLDAMGDVVMSEPALRAVNQAAPGRQVTLLTSPAGAEAAPLLPGVDRVVAYDAPWMKSTAPRQDSLPDREFVRRLRGMKFDGAIIFTVYSQNPLPAAMLCYLADIPLRLAHCRENAYQLLTHWVRETEPQSGVRHEVQRQLDLAAEIGGKVGDLRIRLRIRPADVAAAMSQLRSAGVDPASPWIVVHPGASASSRRWPPEYFAQAVDELTNIGGLQIVFTGGLAERTLVEQIRGLMTERSFSLVGRLSVPQLTSLLSQASMLLSNNTGPVHLAAGVGTPVVDLYALTNPQHTPWQVPSRVLSFDVPCKNCYRSVCPEEHHACLRNVTPEEVVSAVLSLLKETRRTRPIERVAS
jgi:lipopolysaccharide heptosyltransferase II